MSPFEAIAEPNRRAILDLLREGERAAGELVDALALSQPGVSKHLKTLKAAGLVQSRADGQRRLYRLDPAAWPSSPPGWPRIAASGPAGCERSISTSPRLAAISLHLPVATSSCGALPSRCDGC